MEAFNLVWCFENTCISINMTFFWCHSGLVLCSLAESVSSAHFTTQNIVRRQLKDTMPMSCSTQEEMAPSINFLSWITTKQQIIVLEFQEAIFFCTVAHDIAGTQLMFPLNFHRSVPLHAISRQIMCSHSHLTDGYKLNVTIYAPTMLSSPLMVIKCDFFLLLGKN